MTKSTHFHFYVFNMYVYICVYMLVIVIFAVLFFCFIVDFLSRNQSAWSLEARTVTHPLHAMSQIVAQAICGNLLQLT